MDIALAIDKILPAAEYTGSVTANTIDAWGAVVWRDTRRGKPTWAELEAAAPNPLDRARADKLAEIDAGYNTVILYIQAGYPDKEVLTWERQAAQARELREDPEAEALFVRTLAATKGVSVEEMTRRILANAENWEPVAAMLTAQRQIMEEAAWAADSLAALQAIKVGYTV